MNSKNTIVGFLILFSWSCGDSSLRNSQDKSEKRPTYDRKTIRKKINQLVEAKNFQQATHLLDSLILNNPKDGYLFYLKGNTEGVNTQYEAALKDFKTAESLNYDKDKCERMIKATQIVIDVQIK